ncbi:MAG: hypothetical protein JWO67_6112, partial [Streptosporangiaceae bacterium]|nr:hypothetical protein [Streptosporangiaceae bacterium]
SMTSALRFVAQLKDAAHRNERPAHANRQRLRSSRHRARITAPWVGQARNRETAGQALAADRVTSRQVRDRRE